LTRAVATKLRIIGCSSMTRSYHQYTSMTIPSTQLHEQLVANNPASTIAKHFHPQDAID
jgi:hypothetical protein